MVQRAKGRHNTAPGRAAFFQQFLDKVDPESILPEGERIKRAKALRKAYYADLLRKALAARRRKREERESAQKALIEEVSP